MIAIQRLCVSLVIFDWDSPVMVALDWALVALSLAVFAATGDPIWLVGAAIGAAAAWYRPMRRIQTFIKTLARRR